MKFLKQYKSINSAKDKIKDALPLISSFKGENKIVAFANNENVINFSILGYEYITEKDMTWRKYIESYDLYSHPSDYLHIGSDGYVYITRCEGGWAHISTPENMEGTCWGNFVTEMLCYEDKSYVNVDDLIENINYDTLKSISFKINGIDMYAVENMTFGQWCDTDFSEPWYSKVDENEGNWGLCYDHFLCSNEDGQVIGDTHACGAHLGTGVTVYVNEAYCSDKIIEGKDYGITLKGLQQ